MRPSNAVTAPLAVVLAMVGATAAGAEPKIAWRVENNFALLKGETTEARFLSDLEANLACMREEHDPKRCSYNRKAFGLTEQRYPVRFESTRLTFESELLNPRHPARPRDTGVVTVLLSVDGVRSARCEWTVDRQVLRETGCADVAVPVKLETATDVSVRITGRSSGYAQAVVDVTRLVIATFGDSFMSGEGNPHIRSSVTPPRAENWLEHRCHRSLLSASAQAAFRFAERHPQVYVAYLPFACSGSRVGKGLTEAYEGIMSPRVIDNTRGPGDERLHFTGRMLPSQVEQARGALCGRARGSACIEADVAFLSIGINDVGFSPVANTLATSSCDAACRAKLKTDVAAAIDRLKASGSGSLAAAMRAVSDATRARAAYVVEYPDPTGDDKGADCDRNAGNRWLGRFSVGRIDASENRWAREEVIAPVNAAAREVAQATAPWAALTGTAERTRRHGYCADKTFFNSATSSNFQSGTMHPNVLGHEAVAALMAPALERALAARRAK